MVRGAGTNLCGGTIPLRGAVVISPTRMRRILSIDGGKRTAEVEPGLPNLFLKKALEPLGLFYAPDPASQKACTIGGNIGTNAGGPHCLKYGVTSHHVRGLEVVLPDGEAVELDLDQPGCDLTGLFVGSEGTLGIVSRATLALTPIPQRVETMLASFPSMEAAIRAVTDIVSAGIIPATLEAMDQLTVRAVEEFIHAGYPTDAQAVLLIEVDGGDEILPQIDQIRDVCRKNSCGEFRLARDEAEREKLWEGRRGSYPAMARLAPNVLVEDGAVPRSRLPEASRRIRAIAEERGLKLSLIFHAGDGNLHPQILFDERDREATGNVKAAGADMLRVCVELGGTISGEHGVGMDKREAMRWLFTPDTLEIFRKLKRAFDPGDLCNPDKLIPAADGAGRAREASRPEEPEVRSGIFLPRSEAELVRGMAWLREKGKRARIAGAGTRSRPAGPSGGRLTIGSRGLSGVLEHDAENFTVTVLAGTEIDALQKVLAAKDQKALLPSGGTVGGCLAANPFQTPRVRDQVLGLKAVFPDGLIGSFGAKVMKNVAGYDMAKLFLGSRGTLGVIVSVILKTFPARGGFDARPGTGTRKSYASLDPAVRSLHDRIKAAFDPDRLFPGLEETEP